MFHFSFSYSNLGFFSLMEKTKVDTRQEGFDSIHRSYIWHEMLSSVCSLTRIRTARPLSRENPLHAHITATKRYASRERVVSTPRVT